MFSRKSAPREKVPQGWFHHEKAQSTIIFVHGVLSDADSAWRGTAFWPDLVRADDRLPPFNIYLAGYHTGISAGRYSVADCARELLEALSIPLGGHDPVMAGDEIIFVCHSMGGLVVRTLLTDSSHLFADKKIGLVLMASPSMGSRYANMLAPITKALGHSQGTGLQWEARDLISLDERFRQLLHQKRIPRLVGAEAQEHLGPIKTWIGKLFSPPIVPANSGSRYFGAPRLLGGTSHSTITKPSDYEAPCHRFLLRFLLEDYKVDMNHALRSDVQAHLQPGIEISKVLFDSLDRGSLAYYLRRTDDERLSSSMAHFSVWLVGPSGVGKTSAARAQILALGHPVVELCLSAYAGNLSVNSCLDELAYVLERHASERVGTIERSEQSVFREVARIAENGPLILYFDEVPLGGESIEVTQEFTGFIVRLLNFVKDRAHCPEFRILLSSVDAPNETVVREGKVRERLKVVDLALWTDGALKELLDLVLPPLQKVTPSFVPNRGEVVEQSSGLPRELKNALRESIANQGYVVPVGSSTRLGN